jgi:hypothetical protein
LYPIALSLHRSFQPSIGVDSASSIAPFSGRTPMQMREFTIYPRILEAMPQAP